MCEIFVGAFILGAAAGCTVGGFLTVLWVVCSFLDWLEKWRFR